MLVSAVQQCEWAISLHTSSLLSLLPTDPHPTYLGHQRIPSWAPCSVQQIPPSILHLVVYIWGEGNGTPLQYSCLENPMDGGAWWAAVHEVTKSQTWLRDFAFTFHFHALEKEMATHSSVLAWRIPGTGEPGGLPSMESHRVGHNWNDVAAAAVYIWWGWFPSVYMSIIYSLLNFFHQWLPQG